MILAGLATRNHTSSTIDTSLSKGVSAPVSAPVTTPATETTGVPLQGGAPAADPSAEAAKASAASQNTAPAEKAPAAEGKGSVPLQK